MACSFKQQLPSPNEDLINPGAENEGHGVLPSLSGKSVPKLDNVTACVKVYKTMWSYLEEQQRILF
jgi:hypothetical protein